MSISSGEVSDSALYLFVRSLTALSAQFWASYSKTLLPSPGSDSEGRLSASYAHIQKTVPLLMNRDDLMLQNNHLLIYMHRRRTFPRITLSMRGSGSHTHILFLYTLFFLPYPRDTQSSSSQIQISITRNIRVFFYFKKSPENSKEYMTKWGVGGSTDLSLC